MNMANELLSNLPSSAAANATNRTMSCLPPSVYRTLTQIVLANYVCLIMTVILLSIVTLYRIYSLTSRGLRSLAIGTEGFVTALWLGISSTVFNVLLVLISARWSECLKWVGVGDKVARFMGAMAIVFSLGTVTLLVLIVLANPRRGGRWVV